MKTRLLAIVLATAVIFSFAACGKTDDGETTTTAGTTIQTTLQETDTTAAEMTAETGAETNTDSRTGADTTAATTTTIPTTQVASTTSAVKTFTAAQLAEFNGKNGNKGYFAYKGIVYDVTNKPESKWVNGTHNGLVLGKDLTSEFDNCNKHIKSFIEEQFRNYTKVGTYTG
jgi:predicted heme/steroid binding protein